MSKHGRPHTTLLLLCAPLPRKGRTASCDAACAYGNLLGNINGARLGLTARVAAQRNDQRCWVCAVYGQCGRGWDALAGRQPCRHPVHCPPLLLRPTACHALHGRSLLHYFCVRSFLSPPARLLLRVLVALSYAY